MTQHSNEHLTITQLSAYRDQELIPEELALCDAHLQTCQICQNRLANLQEVAHALRRMPQVEVPRSFALPDNLIVIPLQSTDDRRTARRSAPVWQRVVRTFSGLAAILGLLIALGGVISGLPRPTASNTADSAPVFTQDNRTSAGTSQDASPTDASHPHSIPPATQTAQATNLQPTKHTPGASETPYVRHTATPAQTGEVPPQPPAASGINSSEAFSGGGLLLLVLGVFGLIMTRRAPSPSST